MATILTTNANERSTYAITAAFVDTTGAAVTPNSGLVWSLTDSVGTVINARTAVAITSAASIKIILHGADLVVGSYGQERRVTIQGTYDSSIGTGLELKSEVVFYINPLVGVAD